MGYRSWRKERTAALDAASEIVQTARGPVEIARRGRGPALLFSHGGPGGHDQMLGMCGWLAEHFELISPSRPGYLRTPLSTGRSLAEQADALAALLDTLGLERVAVFGASAGGPTAVELAARHPDRVAALLLECAVTQTYRPQIPAWARMLFLSNRGTWLQARLGERFPGWVARQTIAQSATLDRGDQKRQAAEIASSPQKIEVLRTLMGSLTPYDRRRAGLENDLEQLGALKQVPAEAVRCPALVAHGVCDGDVPFADAEFAASHIEGAELHALEKGWHILPLSDGYEALAARELAFLREHLY